jgi:hypothetical protein
MRVTQNPTGKQHKVYYHISQTETILGWTTGVTILFTLILFSLLLFYS